MRIKWIFMYFLIFIWGCLGYGAGQKMCKYYFQGRQISEEEFKHTNGQVVRITYEDGKRVDLTGFKNGKKDGQRIEWYLNGQKKSEGKYFKGAKEGRWLAWDPQGNLITEQLWKDDRLIILKDLLRFTQRSWLYYPNGQMRYQREFKGKIRHGQWIKWSINGNKLYDRQYKNGMKHGRWIAWDESGNVISEEIWEAGKLLPRKKDVDK